MDIFPKIGHISKYYTEVLKTRIQNYIIPITVQHFIHDLADSFNYNLWQI
jgi:hypothetical protein